MATDVTAAFTQLLSGSLEKLPSGERACDCPTSWKELEAVQRVVSVMHQLVPDGDTSKKKRKHRRMTLIQYGKEYKRLYPKADKRGAAYDLTVCMKRGIVVEVTSLPSLDVYIALYNVSRCGHEYIARFIRNRDACLLMGVDSQTPRAREAESDLNIYLRSTDANLDQEQVEREKVCEVDDEDESEGEGDPYRPGSSFLAMGDMLRWLRDQSTFVKDRAPVLKLCAQLYGVDLGPVTVDEVHKWQSDVRIMVHRRATWKRDRKIATLTKKLKYLSAQHERALQEQAQHYEQQLQEMRDQHARALQERDAAVIAVPPPEPASEDPWYVTDMMESAEQVQVQLAMRELSKARETAESYKAYSAQLSEARDAIDKSKKEVEEQCDALQKSLEELRNEHRKVTADLAKHEETIGLHQQTYNELRRTTGARALMFILQLLSRATVKSVADLDGGSLSMIAVRSICEVFAFSSDESGAVYDCLALTGKEWRPLDLNHVSKTVKDVYASCTRNQGGLGLGQLYGRYYYRVTPAVLKAYIDGVASAKKTKAEAEARAAELEEERLKRAEEATEARRKVLPFPPPPADPPEVKNDEQSGIAEVG